MNIIDKNELWKDILTNSESSYNYNFCETEKNLDNNYDILFKDFYNYALKINKNICGYILNNKINYIENDKTYNEEVYTSIDLYNDKEPPGNYINNIFNKDLKIIKNIFIV